jgi:hypothetical protein
VAAGTVFLALLLGFGAVAAAFAYLAYLASRNERLDRKERTELKASRVLIQRIDRLAYAARSTAPELSIQITDEIAAAKNRD